MCGLAGLLAPGPVPPGSRDHVAAMSLALAARGPDGDGLVQAGRCVLAHRRLAIRDARGGAQPMASADGRVLLVYNGELYNDAELRLQLGEHRFATDCDTETVLAAYLKWGADCVEHFRGMFAFAVYDGRSDSLLLARDRAGIKPLFYATARGMLLFASTPAALLEHPDVSRRPDFAAISHYLASFRLTLGRRTLYDGIRQLRPGERLVAAGGRVKLEQWAKWAGCPADDTGTDRPSADMSQAAAVELERTLTDAVDRRLVSDVPVGLLLSGGVDSAVLASMLRDRVGPGMIAMGAGQTGDEELQAAERTAAAVGCDFRPLDVSDESYVRTWEQLLGETRLPLATPSDIPIFQLATEMKKHVGVVIGGEGADELLGGYPLPHFSPRDYRLSSSRHAVKPSEWPSFLASLQQATGRTTFASLTDHFLQVNALMPPALKQAVLQPDVWAAGHGDEPVRAFYNDLLGESGPPERRVYRALLAVNLEGQLSRLDSSTMLAGLEARVPYCDDQFADRMTRLPWRLHLGLKPGTSQPFRAALDLLRDGRIESKRLLRQVAAARLPHAVATRPKASFPTPAARLLAGPLAGEVTSLLTRSRFAKQIFSDEALAGWAANPAAAGMTLWPVVNLVRWGEREFYGGGAHELGAPKAAFEIAPPERRRRRAAVPVGSGLQALRAVR